MKIIGKNLLMHFAERVLHANKIRICVAWSSNCEATSLLYEASNSANIKIVVGVSNSFTTPQSLEFLSNFSNLRIFLNTNGSGIFHPKLYQFENQGITRNWIGSPNLTRGGFLSNVELVSEVGASRHLNEWLMSVWQLSVPFSKFNFDEYKKIYEKAAQNRQIIPSQAKPKLKVKSCNITDMNFDAYAEALIEKDLELRSARHYCIFRDTFSYVETIDAAKDVIRKSKLQNLSKLDAQILLGIKEGCGAWGLLGSMTQAGTAKGYFYDTGKSLALIRLNQNVRSKIFGFIHDLQVAKEFENGHSVVKFIERLSGIPGVSISTASRIAAIARPDWAISVNRGSSPYLNRVFGVEFGKNKSSNVRFYGEMMKKLANCAWFANGRPDEAIKKVIWERRAALIDAFAYVAV